jgi:Cation/multidrug efflux pump
MSSIQLVHLFFFGLILIIFAARFPRFAIRTPVAYSMLIALIVLVGGSSLSRLPVELMPDIAYGNVTIFIEVRGGMPPPDVERLVTKPVEEAMATVSKMKNILSTSKKHRSVVTLEFEPGTNMALATMEVREKFLRVKSKLPKEIERPIIARYEEADAPVVIAALTSDWQTPEELRRYVDERLKEKLLRIDGVANVEIGGGRERKIIVDIDRNKLVAHGVPIKKVVSILEQNNLNMQVGEITGGMSTFALRELGAYRSVSEIENTGIAMSTKGGMVRLKDIGEIKDSYLEAESYSRLNSKSAVTLYIQKESMTNTVKSPRAYGRRLTSSRPGLTRTLTF